MYCTVKEIIRDVLDTDVPDSECVFAVVLTRGDVRHIAQDWNLSDDELETVMQRLDDAFEYGADVSVVHGVVRELMEEKRASRHVTVPAVMLEKVGPTDALRRSFELTRGFVWRNLGVIVVAVIVTGAISGVASLPISLITSGLISLGTEFLWIAGVASVLLAALLSALVTPFLAAITSLLYVDIRMRKEGLDVELIRAVGDSL